MRTEEQPKPSDVHAAQTLLLWPLQAGRRQRAWVAWPWPSCMFVPERPRTSSPSRVARGTEISVPEQTRVPLCSITNPRSPLRSLQQRQSPPQISLFIFLGFPLNDLTKSLRTGYRGNGFWAGRNEMIAAAGWIDTPLVPFRGIFWRLCFCMVKYLSFHNSSSFALRNFWMQMPRPQCVTHPNVFVAKFCQNAKALCLNLGG